MAAARVMRVGRRRRSVERMVFSKSVDGSVSEVVDDGVKGVTDVVYISKVPSHSLQVLCVWLRAQRLQDVYSMKKLL